MKIILMCLLNTFIMAGGQIAFKYGVKGKEISSFNNILSILFSPIILLGLIIYFCGTILWFYILSKTPLSFAYPIQALAFPLVIIASKILFHEIITPTKWIGIAVIVLGVFITTR